MRGFLVVVMALAGAIIGEIVGFSPFVRMATRVDPLPHHVAKFKDAVALRFAMVHDVIHERYPKHGGAYYEERNRLARRAIDQEDARRKPGEVPTFAYFALKDDLAVGLERLGRHEEAIAVLREKSDQEKAAQITGRELYSTKANLGTILILWQLELGFADIPAAKQRLTDGLTLVRESIAVNPEAHFGREIWQAVSLEFLLAALDDPTLLTRYDMIGDSLEREVDPRLERCFKKNAGWGRGLNLAKTYDISAEQRENLRDEITKVGAEELWMCEVATLHQNPVPFDEPTLGIVGMWRYGGGANPHFALALGEIMLRIGQRYIAWCAYERAVQLSRHFNSDAEVVRLLVTHCRKRQSLIEGQIPDEERGRLRVGFEEELRFGRKYQAEYQEYEAKRIRDGGNIDDGHFYDDFDAKHGSIASPVGPEDVYLAEHPVYDFSGMISWSRVVLFAGLFAFTTACLLRLAWPYRRPEGAVPPSPPPGAPPADAVTSR